jgi:hypothetical protein
MYFSQIYFSPYVIVKPWKKKKISPSPAAFLRTSPAHSVKPAQLPLLLPSLLPLIMGPGTLVAPQVSHPSPCAGPPVGIPSPKFHLPCSMRLRPPAISSLLRPVPSPWCLPPLLLSQRRLCARHHGCLVPSSTEPSPHLGCALPRRRARYRCCAATSPVCRGQAARLHAEHSTPHCIFWHSGRAGRHLGCRLAA